MMPSMTLFLIYMKIIHDEVNDDNLSKLILMPFYSFDEPKCVFSRGCVQLLVLSIKLGAFYLLTNLLIGGEVTEKVNFFLLIFIL